MEKDQIMAQAPYSLLHIKKLLIELFQYLLDNMHHLSYRWVIKLSLGMILVLPDRQAAPGVNHPHTW